MTTKSDKAATNTVIPDGVDDHPAALRLYSEHGFIPNRALSEDYLKRYFKANEEQLSFTWEDFQVDNGDDSTVFADKKAWAAERTAFRITNITIRELGNYNEDGDDWALEVTTEKGSRHILTMERNPQRDGQLFAAAYLVAKDGASPPFVITEIAMENGNSFFLLKLYNPSLALQQ